jgi:protein-tyrosine phosphatase
MIDLHTHLLPGIDDGAKSLEESIKIIKKGSEIGITSICITPHISISFNMSSSEKILEKFSELQKSAAKQKINVKLYLGSEIDLRIDFHFWRSLPFFFLNNMHKYLFLELPLGEFPLFAEKMLFSILIEGASPILAHPERSLNNEKDFERIEKLKASGILTQINAGSLSGGFGKKIQKSAERLLKEDLVDMVASDVHDLTKRPITLLGEAFRIVKERFGEKKAEKLFKENPEKVLQAENIEEKIALKYL